MKGLRIDKGAAQAMVARSFRKPAKPNAPMSKSLAAASNGPSRTLVMPTGTPTHAAIFVISLAVLAVGIPTTLLASYSLRIDTTTILQYLVVVYTALRLSKMLHDGEPKWFDTMFWSFTYVFIGLAGLIQRFAGLNPYRVTFSDSSLQGASLLALLGTVTYDMTNIAVRKRFQNSTVFHPRRVLCPRKAKALLIAALVTTPVIVFFLGGVETLLLTRAERTTTLAKAGLFTDVSKVRGGVLLTLSYALPLVASVAAILTLQQDSSLRRRLSWLLGTALLVVGTLFVGNPISTSRFWTGTIVFSLLFTLRASNTVRGYRTLAATVILGILLLFPYADYFRYRDSVATSGLGLGYLMARKGDYDGAVQMASSIDYVAFHGIAYGEQTLGFLGFFVPRSLWADKPGATGTLLSFFVGYPEVNVSSPLWTEGYVDGGIPGVVVAFCLLALASSWLQSRPRLYSGPVAWSSMLMPLAAGYVMIVLRGSLLSSAAGLFTIVALSLLVTEPHPALGRVSPRRLRYRRFRRLPK